MPCFATGTPAPATTIADRVEMLNVPLRSPPVPQVSSTGAGGETGFANSSAVRASPSSSSTVSPFVRRAIRKPPTCAGVTSPVMIARITSAASSAESAWCDASRWSVRGQRSGSGSPMRERTLARETRLADAPRARLHCGFAALEWPSAGVVQWQNASFPSSKRGFDSPHPLFRIRSRRSSRTPPRSVSDTQVDDGPSREMQGGGQSTRQLPDAVEQPRSRGTRQ